MENVNSTQPQQESKFMKFMTKGCLLYLGIAALIFIVAVIRSQFDDDFQDEETRMRNLKQSQTHTCTWCGKTYTHYGFMHLGDECVKATGTWTEIDLNCSKKCCSDSWEAEH